MLHHQNMIGKMQHIYIYIYKSTSFVLFDLRLLEENTYLAYPLDQLVFNKRVGSVIKFNKLKENLESKPNYNISIVYKLMELSGKFTLSDLVLVTNSFDMRLPNDVLESLVNILNE